MKNLILILTLVLGMLAAATARANDIDALQGKWTVKKTGDNAAYTQIIEFKKNKWTFKVEADGNTLFVAEGEAEVKKQGAFNTLRLFNIKAGRTEADLDPVEEERNTIFILNEGRLHLASNFDRVRDNEKPSVDAYSKAN